MTSIIEIFQYDFLWTAFLVLMLLSILSGLLSPIIVAKKYSFIGSAISHSVILSSSLALLIGPSTGASFFLINLFISIGIVLILATYIKDNRIPNDGMIALFFVASMGLGILVQSFNKSSAINLHDLLLGNILLLDKTDLYIAFSVSLLGSLVILAKMKTWVFTIFDEDSAKVSGVPTNLYHYGLYILMAVCIVSFIKVAGTVLVNSLIIFPGAFALKFGKNYKQCFLYGLSFALLSSVLSFIAANYFGTPVGATLATGQFTLLIISLGFKKLLFS